MDRVTQNHAYHDPLMEDERTTRYAQWKRGLVAHSHALVKVVGETIAASWVVNNTGGTVAAGYLSIAFPGLAGPILGPKVGIGPGGSVQMNVSGPMPNLAPGFTYDAQLWLNADPPATVAPGGTHPFTITIPAAPPPPPTEGILSAQGIPTII